MAETPAQIIHVRRPSRRLYQHGGDERSLTEVLMKAAVSDRIERSNQGVTLGRREHPFDMVRAARLLSSNTHHAASISAKKNATTGLGFVREVDKVLRENQTRAKLGLPPKEANESLLTTKRSRVAEVLDPLCDVSFQDLMDHVGEDLAQAHNGYIEVVRKGDDPVNGMLTGLHHLPAAEAWVSIENRQHDYHYEVSSGSTVGGVRRMARFGDKQGFLERGTGGGLPSVDGTRQDSPELVSELIHLRYPSSMSRYYGIPTWLSAVAAIELVQALHQHEFDFYNNRGVPEFLLFLTGKKLSPDEWSAVEDVFRAQIGLGNTRKSGAFNFDADVEVQLEKLAMEGKSDGRFKEISTELALEIVSGHRIPPLLAGITIPGRLGATNELPNALVAFQTLTVAPDQATIQSTFGCTLGNEEVNGGLGLTYDDFEMRTILDEMDLAQMDVVSRMRETVPEAQAEGRTVEDGLEKMLVKSKEAGEASMEDIAELLGHVVRVATAGRS